MGFYEILDQILDLLRHRGRVTYRALKREFQLDDDFIEDLKEEIIYNQKLAVDEVGRVLVWTGDAVTASAMTAIPAESPVRAPLTYTPPYLAEKILTSRSALEGERKQVTVLFADLKGSMELLAALRTLGDAPARSLTALAQRLGVLEADAASVVSSLEEEPATDTPPDAPLVPMTGRNGASSAPKTLLNSKRVRAARKKLTRSKMSCWSMLSCMRNAA